MENRLRINILGVLTILFVISCSASMSSPNHTPEDSLVREHLINQKQVVDIVWNELKPNTSTKDRSNWQVIDTRLAKGNSVAKRFEGDPAPGCWTGPKPAENQSINLMQEYWFVNMKPKPATPMPFFDTPSPTAPPLIPEPFLRDAYFLADKESGEIVARKLICVIY